VSIDISPVLIFSARESEKTVLTHYTYTWPAAGDTVDTATWKAGGSTQAEDTPSRVKVARQALALGLGSMFNHSRKPNVGWERDIPTQSIRYFALRDIMANEELCISYGPKLWFTDVDGPIEPDVMEETDVMACTVDIFN